MYHFPIVLLISATVYCHLSIYWISSESINDFGSPFYKFIFLSYLLPALLDKTCEWCYHWSQERYSCLILLTFPYRRKSPNCLLENSKPFKYHSIRFSCFNLLLVLVGRREKFFIDSGSHQIRWCSCNRKKADWKIDLSQHWCIGCLSSKNMFIFLYLAVGVISQWLQSIADEGKDGNLMRRSFSKVTNIKQWYQLWKVSL